MEQLTARQTQPKCTCNISVRRLMIKWMLRESKDYWFLVWEHSQQSCSWLLSSTWGKPILLSF